MQNDRYYVKPIQLSPIEQLKEEYGVSDLELADAYNHHYNTSVPGPLRAKHAAEARVAIAAVRAEEPRRRR